MVPKIKSLRPLKALKSLRPLKALEVDIHQIRKSLAYNYPLGNERFRKQIEKVLGRQVGYKQRGRPESKNLDGA